MSKVMDAVPCSTMKSTCLLIIMLFASWAFAADTVLLKNGDQLSGTVLLQKDGNVVVEHDVLGVLSLKSSEIKSARLSVGLVDGEQVSGELDGFSDGAWRIRTTDGSLVELAFDPAGVLTRVEPGAPASSVTQMDEDSFQEATPEMKAAAKERIKNAKQVISDAEKVLEKEWKGSVSVGGSLSDGTSMATNLLLDLGIRRKVPDSETKIDAFYILNTDGSTVTQNWFQASVDHYWDLPDTDRVWAIFGQAVFDWQENADWQQRVNGNLGVQYQLIDATRDPGTDWFQKLKLRARLGPGFRKEFSGEYDNWAIEALVGGTWDITFLKGVTLKGNAQFYPDLEDFGQYRVTANTNFMVALESLEGVSVGLGLKFQFQSRVPEDEEQYLIVISGQVAYDF